MGHFQLFSLCLKCDETLFLVFDILAGLLVDKKCKVTEPTSGGTSCLLEAFLQKRLKKNNKKITT